MPFDYKSKEELLQIGLDAISDEFDKSENAFIYQAISATAVIAHDLMLKVEDIHKKQRLDNLEGADLDHYVYDRTGLRRKEATRAVGKVTFYGNDGTLIPQHTVVTNGTVSFVTEYGDVIRDGSVTISVLSEDKGNLGSFPAQSINQMASTVIGVERVENAEVIQPGSNAESDLSLRARYRLYMTDTPTSNNPAHFRQWAKEVDGVGQARVMRSFKGPGTVQVVVLNNEYLAASSELIDKVKANIESKMGFDVVELSVVAPSVVKLNLQLNAEYSDGYESEQVKVSIKERLKSYLSNYADPNYIRTFVSYWDIAVLVKGTEGVRDIRSLTVNGGQNNITLTETQVIEVGDVV